MSDGLIPFMRAAGRVVTVHKLTLSELLCDGIEPADDDTMVCVGYHGLRAQRSLDDAFHQAHVCAVSGREFKRWRRGRFDKLWPVRHVKYIGK